MKKALVIIISALAALVLLGGVASGIQPKDEYYVTQELNLVSMEILSDDNVLDNYKDVLLTVENIGTHTINTSEFYSYLKDDEGLNCSCEYKMLEEIEIKPGETVYLTYECNVMSYSTVKSYGIKPIN